MLALLLGILKVILYIILIILVIIISLIMIILFVPIRYKVEGEKYDTIKIDVCVSWLLHLISFKYYMEEEPTISLKIFGKNVMGEKKEKKVKTKKVKTKKDHFPTSQEEKKKSIKTEAEKTIDQYDSNIKLQEEVNENKKEIEIKEEINISSKKKDKKIKKPKKKKVKDKSNKNISKWKKTFKNSINFLKKEENKAVIKMVKDKALKMLKHILPNKFYSKMIVGTGDPASTGYIVGAVSILYTVTGNKLKVIPNFEEQIFQGCFYGRGRIYMIVLVKNTLRIILDKRVRKLYKTYKA